MLWFEMYMNYWVPFFLGEFLSGHLVTHTVVISSSVNLDRTYCAPVCSRPWDSYQRFFTIQDSSRYIKKKIKFELTLTQHVSFWKFYTRKTKAPLHNMTTETNYLKDVKISSLCPTLGSPSCLHSLSQGSFL
jgi:hypothetical protein